MLRIRWRKDELTTLRKLIAANESAVTISEELGDRTPQAVRKMAARIGLGWKRGGLPDPIKRAALLRIFTLNPNITISAAARLYKGRHQVVGQIVRRLVREGLLIRRGGRTSNCRYIPSKLWRSPPRGLCGDV